MKDVDFIVEELLLEGLGGPDWGRVSKYIQSLARVLHYEPFLVPCEDRLSDAHLEALWDLYAVYSAPSDEYVWVKTLTEGRRIYIADWVVKIISRQAFRFNDHALICEVLELDNHPASPYAYLRDLNLRNSVSLELVKRSPGFAPNNTGVILAYLKRQYIHHVDELAVLVPWLASFLGLKPSGRGHSRVFHSDRSIEILLSFSEVGEVKNNVVQVCEPLLLSKKKSVRLAAKTLFDGLDA